MNFMKPPIRISGVRGTTSPVTGSLPEHRLEQVVAARAFGQLGQREQDGFADEADDVAHHRLAEIDQAIDRPGEDRLGALPDAAEIEDVRPGQRIRGTW